MRLVRDVMNPSPITVDRQASFKDIALALDENGMSAACVIDGRGDLIGILSDTDLVLSAASKSGWRRRRRFFGRRRGGPAPIAEALMSDHPVTVSPDDTVARAVLLAETADVRQLPVVNAQGVLCGLVTRRDLLREFLRRDLTIRSEIVDHVLAQEFSLEPGAVTVSVEGGVATLTGQLENGDLAEDIVVAVDQVPGVVRTEARLTTIGGRHRTLGPNTRAAFGMRPG